MPSSNFLTCRSPATLALAVILATGSWSPGTARAQEPCSVTQITSSATGGSLADDISSNGRWLTLESQADLTGGNADHNVEIFRYDLLGGAFLQVTDTVGHSNTGSEISDDGGRIAFRSTSGPGIFVYEVTTGQTREVIAEDVGASSMSGGGDRFTFLFAGDPTGQNPDGNTEIFVYHLAEDRFVQVTDSVAESCGPFPDICPRNFPPSISTDGSAVVFASDHAYGGAGGPSVYVFEVATESIEAIAPIVFAAGFPTAISGDGRRVAYTDGDGGLKVFDRPSGSTTTSRIADAPRPQALDSRGRRVVFHDSHFDGLLFAFDPDAGTETQLTTDGANLFQSRISGDGSVIATAADADWTGQNPDGLHEVFVLSCSPTGSTPIDIPTLRPAGLLILILSLAGGGVLVLRRRSTASEELRAVQRWR